jgi:hypothetical protein
VCAAGGCRRRQRSRRECPIDARLHTLRRLPRRLPRRLLSRLLSRLMSRLLQLRYGVRGAGVEQKT